jgi:hypothetical protein
MLDKFTCRCGGEMFAAGGRLDVAATVYKCGKCGKEIIETMDSNDTKKMLLAFSMRFKSSPLKYDPTKDIMEVFKLSRFPFQEIKNAFDLLGSIDLVKSAAEYADRTNLEFGEAVWRFEMVKHGKALN